MGRESRQPRPARAPSPKAYKPRAVVIWPSALLGTAYRADGRQCRCGEVRPFLTARGLCAVCALRAGDFKPA